MNYCITNRTTRARRSLVATFFGLLAASVVLIASHGVAWCDPTADLWTAIGKGDVAAARAAIEAGADVNAKDRFGETPLLIAARSKNGYDLVQILVAKGATLDVKATYSLGDTLLHEAARNGAKDLVAFLISKGADVNAQNQYGATPLFAAAQSKNGYDIVQLLVAKGAKLDVKATDKSGDTLLLAATVGGNKDLVALLISKGADVNAKNQYGDTPLFGAAGSPNGYGLVQLLVSKGAQLDIKATDKYGLTLLDAAASGGNKDLVAFLIAKGAYANAKDQFGDTPLFSAALGGHSDVAALLIAKGADVNAKDQFGNTPLFSASKYGHPDAAALLIAKGADVNAKNHDGETPLLVAARSKNGYEAAQLLIAQGAQLKATDNRGNTLLHAAASGGNKDLVALLIAKGGNVNAKNDLGDTPLLAAALNGHTNVAALLIAKGADVNSKNHNGETPIIEAARSGHTDTAALLIARGARLDVKATDQYGDTLLHKAASQGAIDFVAFLIAQGARVNTKNHDGETPLFGTSRSEVAALLVAKGANVNAKNQYGETPLFYAAKFGRKDIAALLIAKGADVNATNKEGWTPLHYAQDKQLAKLLVTKGVDTSRSNTPDQFYRGLDAAKALRWNEAVQSFLKARELAPQKPEIYFNLALALEKYGRNGVAAMCFEAYLALAPDAPNKDQVRSEIIRLTAQARAQMATIFQSAVKLAASINDCAHCRASAYEDVAESFAKAGELSKALQYGAFVAQADANWGNPTSRELDLREKYAKAISESGSFKAASDQVGYIEQHFSLSADQRKSLRSSVFGPPSDRKVNPWSMLAYALHSYEWDPVGAISFDAAIRGTGEVKNDYDRTAVKLSGKQALVVTKLGWLGSQVGMQLLQLGMMQRIWQSSPQCRIYSNEANC